MTPMQSENEPLGLTTILGPAALVAIGVFVLHLLPAQILNVLTAWTLVSFPIGVLIGHCALSEE
jgi:hypothetical protein